MAGNLTVVAFLLVAVLVIYGVVGGIILGRWLRPRQGNRPQSFRVDHDARLSLWLPKLIAVQVFAWSGAALMCILTFFLMPHLRGVNARYTLLGFGIGLVGYAVLFVGLDVLLVIRFRGKDRSTQGQPNRP